MKKQNQKIKIEKIVDLLRNYDENETFCDSLYILYVLHILFILIAYILLSLL